MMTDRGLVHANARAALGGEPGATGAALAGASALGRVALGMGAPRPSRRYCAGCASVCEGALDAPLPVADVMRYLMYARSYGDRERARREFAALPAEVREALSMQDYRVAERRCPEQLPIGRLMREASLEL